MKLWNSKGNIDKAIEKFTIGDDPQYDLILASYDVKGSMVHAKMLNHIGYLTDDESSTIIGGLNTILNSIEAGDFKINEGVEDIHSQVEFLLIKLLGDTGKKLHVGRSRNDQIALDLKLFYKDVLLEINEDVTEIIDLFLIKAEETKDVLMPGYTHSQAGMISSFGLWYSSFAESLVDDLRLMNTVLNIVDQNPLGSAAGYGSSLPNDRIFSTEQLGFKDLIVNSIYAQSSRGKAELNIGFSFSNLGNTLNRFASDICIFSNENYRFIKLPDQLTTGSSIMPHKKNPDIMELIRGKCNQLAALPIRINLLLNNMQTGYHRDYQLLKEILFPEIEKVKQILSIIKYTIPQIEETHEILKDHKYAYCYSVEHINERVKSGVPFRDAYHDIKTEIENGIFSPNKINIKHTHIGSIGNLGLDLIRKKLKDLRI